MRSCFPCQFTKLSKWVLVPWPILLWIGITWPPSCPKQKSCCPWHAISAALHNTLCASVSLPFRDLGKPFSSFPWNCQASPSAIQSQKLPSPIPSGPKFDGNVLTAAPVSRFIFTHSELSSESELTDVSCGCSVSSCHPTQLLSSFHSSKFQPSFHSSGLHSSWIHDVSVV